MVQKVLMETRKEQGEVIEVAIVCNIDLIISKDAILKNGIEN